MLAVLLATQLALSPCKPPGVTEELRCGKLTVFENRAARSGRTIDLNVVVLPALDAANKREPLFELTGGPGLAGTGAAGLYRRSSLLPRAPRRRPRRPARHRRVEPAAVRRCADDAGVVDRRDVSARLRAPLP